MYLCGLGIRDLLILAGPTMELDRKHRRRGRAGVNADVYDVG
jgi:hypothetical protein